MTYLNLASVRVCTEAEGPGKRFAIWCQGCNRRCSGCCNPEMQKLSQNTIVDVEDLKSLILQSKKEYEIEGVSLIGGEPLLQVEGLLELVRWCKKVELSVLLFTGYTYEELQVMNNEYVVEFLKYIDILIDGPFIESEYDTERVWVGSRNQNVIFLSNWYEQGIEYEKNERSMEIFISQKEILVNGWPFGI